MPKRDYSAYQQKVIKRYYDNRDQIDEQRLAELVTSLYLASEKKAVKLWDSAQDLMKRLGVSEKRVAHIMEKRDPQILASVVEDLQKGLISKPKPNQK